MDSYDNSSDGEDDNGEWTVCVRFGDLLILQTEVETMPPTYLQPDGTGVGLDEVYRADGSELPLDEWERTVFRQRFYDPTPEIRAAYYVRTPNPFYQPPPPVITHSQSYYLSRLKR